MRGIRLHEIAVQYAATQTVNLAQERVAHPHHFLFVRWDDRCQPPHSLQ